MKKTGMILRHKLSAPALSLLGALVFLVGFPGVSFAVKTYTVDIPDNMTCGPVAAPTICVTMGDENFITLPHRVTHTGDTKEIKILTFNLPVGSDYSFNTATAYRSEIL